MMSADNPLINGILEDASQKAKDIVRKAEEECKKIIDEANEKAVKEAELEKRSYSVRLDRIELREESARKNIDRLSELKSLDSAYNLVMKEAEKRLADIVSSADFSRILISWIAEAAIGLDRKEAKVSFSEKAPVDEGMLREAEKLVKKNIHHVTAPVLIHGTEKRVLVRRHTNILAAVRGIPAAAVQPAVENIRHVVVLANMCGVMEIV